MATYKDIDNWRYSMEQLNEMHEMLDLKERIDSIVSEASHG